MTTMKQELLALAQIREIVESLGKGSYLEATFKGVFEVAEENIVNDWFVNVIEQAEEMQRKAEKMQRKAEEIKKKFEIDRRYWEDTRSLLDRASYHLSDKLGY